MPSPRGVQRGLPLALLGNFQRCLQCGSENSLISYGIFPVNTLRRAVCLPVSYRLDDSGVAVCARRTRSADYTERSKVRLSFLYPLHPNFPYYFSPFGRRVAGRSFPFSKALLHGAVGYKVFPINTLAAKREEDLSGNGAAARPFSRHKAPCLLCLCKRE